MDPKWYHVCWPRLTAKRVEPVVSISWASCLSLQSNPNPNPNPTGQRQLRQQQRQQCFGVSFVVTRKRFVVQWIALEVSGVTALCISTFTYLLTHSLTYLRTPTVPHRSVFLSGDTDISNFSIVLVKIKNECLPLKSTIFSASDFVHERNFENHTFWVLGLFIWCGIRPRRHTFGVYIFNR